MAYLTQTFSVGEVLASAKMNQVEVNIRDHIHGEAGVTGTTRALAPGSHAVYDIGTPTLYYRNAYVQNLPGFAFLPAIRFYTDFVTSTNAPLSVISGFVATGPVSASPFLPGWIANIGGVAGAVFAWGNPGSRGVLNLQATNAANAYAKVFRQERVAVSDWASLEFSANIQGPDWALSGGQMTYNFGFGIPDSAQVPINSGDMAAWTAVASAAIAPRTALGAAVTVGNCLALVASAGMTLGVTLSSGTAKFYTNNSLWQTITTNIPSSRYLTPVIEEMGIAGGGTNVPLNAYDMLFNVNST